jgi:hypothetical protein
MVNPFKDIKYNKLSTEEFGALVDKILGEQMSKDERKFVLHTTSEEAINNFHEAVLEQAKQRYIIGYDSYREDSQEGSSQEVKE